jgi:hypothetical protein
MHYSSPTDVLANYLEYVGDKMLILNRPHNSNGQGNVIQHPRSGSLVARYEADAKLLWVLKKSFNSGSARSPSPL